MPWRGVCGRSLPCERLAVAGGEVAVPAEGPRSAAEDSDESAQEHHQARRHQRVARRSAPDTSPPLSCACCAPRPALTFACGVAVQLPARPRRTTDKTVACP
eukprot:1346737-Rhodomonas_salina.5